MIDLCKIKEDFSVLVKEAQPWTLTQFVMWLDLKLSEFKIKGYMVLDHNVKTKPKWLVDDETSGEVAPPPAPCRLCNKSSNQDGQFYSDIHASASDLQRRTVTKDVVDKSQQPLNEDTNVRGGVGIIDLSHGMVPNKNLSAASDIQIQSYRQISSHDYNMTDTERSIESDKRVRPEVIEIDAPSPPEKMFISGSKSMKKTSTPVSLTKVAQRPKVRPSLSMGTAIYTSTSSSTTTTFSTSYTSAPQRNVQSNMSNRKYALGAPPSTSSTSFPTSSNMSDYQNLENLIAQTVQYSETLMSQNQPSTSGISDHLSLSGFSQAPRRQSQSNEQLRSSQSSFSQHGQISSSQSSFSDLNVEPQNSYSANLAEQQFPQISLSNQDQNLFTPPSEAVPVALHANMDVINRHDRDNSLGSAPSTSDITEIKIESDPEESLSESFQSEANTSLMDTQLSDTSQTTQSPSKSYPLEPGGQPKPGLVDPETAKVFQMVELVTGSGVYVFDRNIAKAFEVGTEKETGTYSGEKMARYLLNVFWSRKELVGATLSKAGRGKKILNQQIIEAILEFCVTNGRQSRPMVKKVLRDCVSNFTWRAKKRMLRTMERYKLK